MDYIFVENNSKIFYNGSTWKSLKGGNFKIIGKEVRKGCYVVEFENGYIRTASYGEIRNGKIKNHLYPTLYGKGCLGVGEWRSWKGDSLTKEYVVWQGALNRCYSNQYPSYKDCIVDERWHNFQNFCEDIQELENYSEWKNCKAREYDLDKDILCDSLNIKPKIYSKKTCKFVSHLENLKQVDQTHQLTGITYVAERLSDNYTEEFTNQAEFARKWNLCQSHVNSCISGKRKKHKGWRFPK